MCVCVCVCVCVRACACVCFEVACSVCGVRLFTVKIQGVTRVAYTVAVSLLEGDLVEVEALRDVKVELIAKKEVSRRGGRGKEGGRGARWGRMRTRCVGN